MTIGIRSAAAHLTTIDPDLHSIHAGGIINLPLRPAGGFFQVKKDAEAVAFNQKFKTLDDLYEGTAKEKQGAILIDAHYTASAAGANCTARPEDTEIAPDGSLYITFTSGSASDSDGGPDLRIFPGKDGKPYEYGWIMRLIQDGNKPSAMSFEWKMFGTGGEPAEGGLGFANPDNLVIDKSGNVWMVNDIAVLKRGEVCPRRPMPYAHGGRCPRRPMPTEADARCPRRPMPTEADALCP